MIAPEPERVYERMPDTLTADLAGKQEERRTDHEKGPGSKHPEPVS